MLKKIIRLFVIILSLTVISIPTVYLTKDTVFKPIIYWFFSKETTATVTKGCTMKPSKLRRIHIDRCTDVVVTFKVNNMDINATIDEYYGIPLKQFNIRYAIFDPSIVIADKPQLFLFLLMLFFCVLGVFPVLIFLASIDELIINKIKDL